MLTADVHPDVLARLDRSTPHQAAGGVEGPRLIEWDATSEDELVIRSDPRDPLVLSRSGVGIVMHDGGTSVELPSTDFKITVVVDGSIVELSSDSGVLAIVRPGAKDR